MKSFHREATRFIRIQIPASTRNKPEQPSSLRYSTNTHWKCDIHLLPAPAVQFTGKHFLKLPTDGTITRVITLSVCAGTWGLGFDSSSLCLDCLDSTMQSDSTGFKMVCLAIRPALPLCWV